MSWGALYYRIVALWSAVGFMFLPLIRAFLGMALFALVVYAGFHWINRGASGLGQKQNEERQWTFGWNHYYVSHENLPVPYFNVTQPPVKVNSYSAEQICNFLYNGQYQKHVCNIHGCLFVSTIMIFRIGSRSSSIQNQRSKWRCLHSSPLRVAFLKFSCANVKGCSLRSKLSLIRKKR